jgi:hypothetical protein
MNESGLPWAWGALKSVESKENPGIDGKGASSPAAGWAKQLTATSAIAAHIRAVRNGERAMVVTRGADAASWCGGLSRSPVVRRVGTRGE